MGKRPVDSVGALAVMFEEESEDVELEKVKYLDKKYFKILRCYIFIASILVGISMYSYMRNRIVEFTKNDSIISTIAVVFYICVFSIMFANIGGWKYRFRKSVIQGYNKILIILGIIAVTNFMSFKLIPWINYFVLMHTYGLGYKFVIWIFTKEISIAVKICLSIIAIILFVVIYFVIVCFFTGLFSGCYRSDRLSDQVYVKKTTVNASQSYNKKSNVNTVKQKSGPSVWDTMASAIDAYEEAKTRENIKNISDKLDSINYKMWND